MTALILAAYGSSNGHRLSAPIRRMAERLAAEGRVDEVHVAFHKEPPLFPEALDQTNAEQVIVVPILTSGGYTYRTTLPVEMGLTGQVTRRGHQTIHLTRPIGEAPQVTNIMAGIARRATDRHGLAVEETALVLAGHGTERDAASAAATLAHVERLRERAISAQTLAVFLNQPPLVQEVFGLTDRPNLVVIPNLLGGSIHVTRDIPHELGVEVAGSNYPPPPTKTAGRTIVLTETPYEDPLLDQLVWQTAVNAGQTPPGDNLDSEGV